MKFNLDFILLEKNKNLIEGNFQKKKSILVENEANLSHLFDIAAKYWQSVFDEQSFLTNLENYLKTGPTEELKSYFKKIRKAALILKSAQLFCNKNPILPKNFILFIRYLGKTNDAFDIDLGKKYAHRLVAILGNNNLDVPPFSTITVEEYEARVASFIINARDLLW